MKHGQRVAMVWGGTPPVYSIGYDEPLGPWDSGFTVLFDDAPEPEDVETHPNPLDHPDISTVCLHCLIEDNPEIGRGLDIARDHQVANLNDQGEWVIGDPSRLDD